MINLDDIKSRGAVTLLQTYSGVNPYLKDLKKKLVRDTKISLTEGQVEYINKFHDVPPQVLNRVVSINPLLGESLQAKDKLSFLPEKILIQAMLADQEKTYHVYGKLKQNQKHSKMYWLPKTLVLDDPYYTDCDIEVDWTKYEEMDLMGRHPYDHQKEGIKFLVCRKGAILADDMGLGKCVSISESVYCPTGKVKMGDLEVGDYVIGSDGKKTKVLEVHPQPKKELFKVTFNDGYSTICCKEHMWTVTSNNGSLNNKNRPTRYTNLTIEQMLDKDLELEQKGFGWNEKRPYKFKTYYKESNGQNKWQIPIVKPIQFENEFTLPINPYLLGVTLGDGHIKKNGSIMIELHEDDFDELFENQILNEIKGGLRKRRNSINVLKEEIKALNLNGTLSHTKFIPYAYKYGSIEDRLSILQGLMDTDGHCMKSKNGNFTGTEYCTVSEQLTDDVAEIVHSLGGIVRKKSKIGSYKKDDGTKVMCKRAYRLNIKLPEGMNPFRLKRKADEYNVPQKYKVGRYIKNIESIGDGDSVCIKVDAEDSLFVINHGIVTHNTYQSIIAALEVDAKKVLIICPASVKITWQREIEAFEQKAIIVSGRKFPHVGRFTIINFDILKNFHTIGNQTFDKEGNPNPFNRQLVNEEYDLVIIDEAHKIKDHKTQRGKICNELALTHGIDRVWQLTGTPIANRPMDFFNLLKMIKSPLGDNWKFFAQRYCDAKRFYKTLKNGQSRQIWITNGHSNLDELSIRTKNSLLRRLKTDVLDMPDKTISTNYHTLSKRGEREYETLWDEYMEKRAEEGKRKISDLSRDIVELGLLRKFIAMETIPHTLELAKEAIEQGQKVVIFTTFTDELDLIAENFTNTECVTHNGKMTANAKQKSVDKFQTNKKCKVFVGNVMSAGVGITLTEGTVVIFNSFSWVPGDNEQAEDRCYRIGQTNNVSVYYQLFTGTVSLVMWYTLMRKQEVINKIIGKNDDHGIRLKMLMDDLEENGLEL